MLKKKAGFFVVLVMVFAIIFAACDPGGDGEITLEPGSHGTLVDSKIIGLESGKMYILYADGIFYGTDEYGVLNSEGNPLIHYIGGTDVFLAPGVTEITGLDNNKSYSVFQHIGLSGANITIGASDSDFDTGGKNTIFVLSSNPLTIKAGVGGAAENARATLIFYWASRGTIAEDYDGAVYSSLALETRDEEIGMPGKETYIFSETTPGTARVRAVEGALHFTIYNINNVFTTKISWEE